MELKKKIQPKICPICDINPLEKTTNAVSKYICSACIPAVVETIQNSKKFRLNDQIKTTVNIEVNTGAKQTTFTATGSNFEEISEEIISILEGIEAIHF